jgi:muramoyltetrapeptide carboxypeptidase
MIKPRALAPGMTLGIVSPASPISEELLLKGLSHYTERGYKFKIMPNALAATHYLAGSDEARIADLIAAFEDSEVDGVLCSRGGYGCARIIDDLPINQMVNSRKPLIGYSDITTLHIAWQNRGAISFYAPMPLTLAYPREPWVVQQHFDMIEGRFEMPTEARKPECVIPGEVEGLSVGGCMILVCDSIGTQNPIDAKGKILFLEDVDENPHRVDAMLTHLLNAGILQSCAGIVVGEMTRTDERSDPTIGASPWRDIVRERLLKSGVPCVLDYPFGHAKTMLTLPFGVMTRLNAQDGNVQFLESPCAN